MAELVYAQVLGTCSERIRGSSPLEGTQSPINFYMKILSKNNSTNLNIDASSKATEYEMDDKEINGAVIEILGRSPISGKVVNTACKEMVYVLSGSGVIEFEGKETPLHEGDMILIHPNEQYYWNGHMTLFSACTPAWNINQSKRIP